MKLHGNGAIFLLIFSEAKLSRIPATLPTPCDIIGQKAAFFDFLCADRKSAMSKKSSKIKGFRVRKKYFCEYLTHSDYFIRVVTDAVAGSSEEAHRYALKAIKYLQRDALITVADVENSD